MKWGTRKIISLAAMAVLVFVVVFVALTSTSLPPQADVIITACIGWIGYYFGKSTALDGAGKEDTK